IISAIREEVASQKECLTRYCIQGIAFVGIVWGLVFKLDGFGWPFYFCNTLLIFLLLVIVRMANHKYSTINRNLGYELHLNRLKDYAGVGNPDWARKMMDVNWEEAMCAWRFVQPSIFEKIYQSSDKGFDDSLRPYIRKDEQCQPELYYWYETNALMPEGGSYHQGRYLHNIHRFLNTVGGFSLITMASFLAYKFLRFCVAAPSGYDFYFGLSKFAFVAVMFGGISYYYCSQVRRQTGIREILEGGILSIQSCAVVWRIVVTCHILGSLYPLSKNKGYYHYTTYTSALGLNFIGEYFNQPHDWLSKWETLYGTPELRKALHDLLHEVKPRPFKLDYLQAAKTVSITEFLRKFFRLITTPI
ncbi:MAG TPA: hypothetical protein VHC44_17470, partial [Verrucomicrobiae bacterium]|nr:hypothetical protein [Verrucomicrobiae bacterium]